MSSIRLSQIQGHLSPGDPPVLTSSAANGRVIYLTINNATRANCLSTPVLQALLAALSSINPQVHIDSSIDTEDPIVYADRVRKSHSSNVVPKVVIIKSAGHIFCSGHDLREFHNANGNPDPIQSVFNLCNELMLTIRRIPQIVISQVQGLATAAGCQLAAQADLCVASPSATFATPGIQRGGFCTTPSVAISRCMQPKQALRMIFTGERFSAQQAYESGLVSHIATGDLDEYTLTLALEIAKAASSTLILGKRAFYEQLDKGIVDAYDLAGKVMTGNFCMKDSMEGVSAFLAKRTPKWD